MLETDVIHKYIDACGLANKCGFTLIAYSGVFILKVKESNLFVVGIELLKTPHIGEILSFLKGFRAAQGIL